MFLRTHEGVCVKTHSKGVHLSVKEHEPVLVCMRVSKDNECTPRWVSPQVCEDV